MFKYKHVRGISRKQMLIIQLPNVSQASVHVIRVFICLPAVENSSFWGPSLYCKFVTVTTSLVIENGWPESEKAII